MDSDLLSLNSISTPLLSTSCTSWTINIILAILCGVLLFFLLLPFFLVYTSLPKKTSNIKKPQVEKKSSSRERNKNESLQDCSSFFFKELLEAKFLIALLQTYLELSPDKHRLHCRKRWLSKKPLDKDYPRQHSKPKGSAASIVSPTSAVRVSQTRSSRHGASPISEKVPKDSSEWKMKDCSRWMTEDSSYWKIVPENSSGNSSSHYSISYEPVTTGLDCSGHASPAPSCLMTSKALLFPSGKHQESQQHHASHHPSMASFWSGHTKRKTVIRGSSFLKPEVQKFLEAEISKKVEVKNFKEKKKDEYLKEPMCLDYHLNSLGVLKSFSHEQTTTEPQPFWSKPVQLPSPRHLIYFKTLPDHLHQKCNQLFYGLPSLHSESLVTNAWVSGSSYTSPSPSILFNRMSNACPVQVSPLLSPPQPLPNTEPQPQQFILTTPQTQIFPMSPVLTQAHRISSLPIPPPPSTSQMGTYGISCPKGQSETQSLVVTEIQHPEPSLLGKQLESKTLPSVMKRSKEAACPLSPELPQYNSASEVHRPDSIHPRQDPSRTEFHKLLKQHFQKTSTQHQQSLPNMIPESPKLTQLQGKLPGPYQTKDQHGSSWPSVFTGDSRTDVKKMRSCHQESCDVRNPEDFQLGKVLENSLGEIPKHNMCQVSEKSPVKVLQTRAEAVFQGQNLQGGWGEKATSKPSAPSDEKKHFRRPEPKEKRLPGLRTTQDSRMSHLPMKTSAQNKRSAESLGIKPSQISTEKRPAPPEVHIKKTSDFVQSICPIQKDKEHDDPLHKGKPTSNSAYNCKPVKSSSILMGSGVAEAHTLMTAVSHILVEKLGLQEKSCVSKLNQTKEKMPERMSLVGGHLSSQISHSSPEHRRQTSDTVYRNQINQMARIRHKMTHEGNRNLYTMVGFEIRDRGPLSPINPHKQESKMDSGCPHHSTICHQNHFCYNQPENASQAFPCRESFPIQSKPVYPHFSTFPMC